MTGEYERGYAMLMDSLRLNENPYACAKLGFSLYYYQNKNYQESSRWLQLLPPFDLPFASILAEALKGNMIGEVMVNYQSHTDLKGHEFDIVNRIVQDHKLRNDIISRLQLSGFGPNIVDGFSQTQCA
jgi:hypothetical protein